MAFGDVGGSVTELVITCRTPHEGVVDIESGDAVKFTAPYTVSNVMAAEDPVFGEALASTTENDRAIPVKVRGISILTYTGAAPAVDGVKGIVASATAGAVKAPATGNGRGINLKVDTANSEVHVLL